MQTMKKQTFATVVEATGDEPSITISTASVDRDGDVLVPEGADLRAYRESPVVGWQHFRDDSLPIGSTVRLDVEEGRGIRASWRWLEGDPMASRVRNAFEQNVVRAASVGFLPVESEPIPETRGRRYTKWEMVEWSLVAIPSNRESVRVLRSLGLWTDDDEGRAAAHGFGPKDVVLDIVPTYNVTERQVAERVRAVVPPVLFSGLRAALDDGVNSALRYSRGRLD